MANNIATSWYPRKPGVPRPIYSKHASEIGSTLCTNCQEIFQGDLSLGDKFHGDGAGIAFRPFKLYGNGQSNPFALLSPTCHLCFLRRRNLSRARAPPTASSVTRYRIDLSTENGVLFALRFSYSDIAAPEEITDSSAAGFSDTFEVSPLVQSLQSEIQGLKIKPLFERLVGSLFRQPQTVPVPSHVIEDEEGTAYVNRPPMYHDLELEREYQRLKEDYDSPADSLSSTDCASTWRTARLWIQNCHERHPQCRPFHPSARSLPNRLISIGEGPAIQPRVVDGAHLANTTLYTTLSHHWGNQEFLTLTKANSKELYSGITVAGLHPTFVTAMQATMRLGYQYIWIDSLCIIQDSPDDWLVEAQNMGGYYSNTVCNLAASKASGDHGSCFAERDPRAAQPCIVQDMWTNTTPQFTFQIHDSMKQFHHSALACKLATRGWVVQETILSPRVLYLGRDQVFWECLGLRASEVNPDRWFGLKYYNKFGRSPIELFSDTRRAKSTQDILRWDHLIETYSSCDLTFPRKDKLIAIAGIGAMYSEKADFRAGVWLKELNLLLWKPKIGSIPYSEYIAPSWSWASIDGAVEYEDVWDDEKAEIESSYSHQEDTKYELLKRRMRKTLDYSLSLAGLTYLPKISTPFVSLDTTKQNPQTETGSDGFLCLKGFLFRLEKIDNAPTDPDIYACHLHLFPDDSSIVNPSVENYVFLPIRMTSKNTIRGLLLQKFGVKQGRYVRVGLFFVRTSIHLRGFEYESLILMKNLKDYQYESIGRDEYEKKTGHSKDSFEEYTFTIQ